MPQSPYKPHIPHWLAEEWTFTLSLQATLDQAMNHISVVSTSHNLIRKSIRSFFCQSELNIWKILVSQNRMLGEGCCLWPHISISSKLLFYFQMFVLKIKFVLFKMWQPDCTEVKFFCPQKSYLSRFIIKKAEEIYPCCWFIAVQNLKGKTFQPPIIPSDRSVCFFSGNPQSV